MQRMAGKSNSSEGKPKGKNMNLCNKIKAFGEN